MLLSCFIIRRNIIKKNQLPNDILLIIECCKTDEIKNIEYLISQVTNWNSFIESSVLHGVLPLVYHTLKKYSSFVPQDIINRIKSINMDIAKQNMLMTAELIRVSKYFEENNVEVIAFKGPILSKIAYGDITFRQYVDLDIFIKIDELDKIKDLLKKTNYKMTLPLNEYETNFRKKYSHDLSMTNISTNISIEIHWNFLDNDNPISLKGLNAFKDTNKVQLNNIYLNSLNIEKLLIYLCVHGASHLYERVEWVFDIDQLIRRNGINWDEFDYLLEECYEVKNSIYLSLFYSYSLFNTSIPKKYIKIEYSSFLKRVQKRLYCNNSEFSNILLKTRLYSSYINKIKYLFKVTFKPTLNELRYINLDKKFYFLYYFIRIYLTVKKLYK